MRPLLSMRDALRDPEVFGAVFAGSSWDGWRVLLIASCGEALTDDERVVFKELTGRDHEPGVRCEEIWCVVGRRSGKTRAAAVLAAYLGGLCDYPDLAPGERVSLLLMSASLAQSTKAFGYIRGLFERVEVLRSMVIGENSESIALSNSVDIECVPASYRTVRGRTLCACVADEIAFWWDSESRNPVVQILNAVRPALMTLGGPLICLSSPHGKKGALWDAYKRDYGPNGDPAILIAKGASRQLNPLLSEKVVARAYDRDPAAASAEFGGDFRSDVAVFVDRDIVEGCVEAGVLVRPPLSNRGYVAFVDPSGGSSDSFSLAIAHKETVANTPRVCLNLVIEKRPPFSPDAVVREFSAVLRGYRVHRVVGDRYAGEWPREAFRKQGITYEPSERNKSAIYLDFLPLLMSGSVDLIDNQRLVNQLASLERRTARGGRDSIDHPPGAHDDVANAAAGALVLATARAPLRISDAALMRARMDGRPALVSFSAGREFRSGY